MFTDNIDEASEKIFVSAVEGKLSTFIRERNFPGCRNNDNTADKEKLLLGEMTMSTASLEMISARMCTKVHSDDDASQIKS